MAIKRITGNKKATAGIIIGIDSSTKKSGVVVLQPSDGNDPICREHVEPPAKIKGMARRHAMHSEVMRLVLLYGPALVVFEGYAFGTRVAQLVEQQTLIRHSCWFQGIPFTSVNPSQLKTFVCNKGNANKDVIALHVAKRWGFEHESDDVVDAFAAAKLGQMWRSGEPLAEKYTKSLGKNLQVPRVDA